MGDWDKDLKARGFTRGAEQYERGLPGIASTKQLTAIAHECSDMRRELLRNPSVSHDTRYVVSASWRDYQMAAAAITPLARRYLVANYEASGLGKKQYAPGKYQHTGWLRNAIGKARMVLQWNSAKRMPVMRMEMDEDLRPPHDKRENVGTMVAGSLDAGSVRRAGKGLGARGKRTLKKLVAGESVHFLMRRRLESKTKALSTASVHLGYRFFRFTPQQKEALKRAFFEAYERQLYGGKETAAAAV